MVGIIIQARMGSHRLPGKILMDFEGKTLLNHILDRLDRLDHPVKIVIATSNLKQDDVVESFCREQNICCFRGDERNVLKRYFDCASKYQFDTIVRMTGDNPFPDIDELDRMISFHLEEKLDFSENFSVLPIGVGMEIMSYPVLQQSFENAWLPKHFEHPDEYILDHLTQYKHGISSVASEKNRPDVSLTVDTGGDYEKACYILQHACAAYVTTQRAIELSDDYERDRQSRI